MPTDPNARGTKAIEDLTREVKLNNALLKEQNGLLKNIEKKLKPRISVTNHPYLDPSSGGIVDGEVTAGDNDGDASGR